MTASPSFTQVDGAQLLAVVEGDDGALLLVLDVGKELELHLRLASGVGLQLPAPHPFAVRVEFGVSRCLRKTWSRLVSALGFSKGWAEFALKKPPPLVPSSLMASCEATRPPGMTWLAPLTPVTVSGSCRFWMTPRA